jgi:hypothetical protein
MIRAKTSVYDELQKLYGFENLEVPENEAELVANQRFEKIIRLNQLGIYIDEAHHVFGQTMERELKSLRITVNEMRHGPRWWAAIITRGRRTSIIKCYQKWFMPMG